MKAAKPTAIFAAALLMISAAACGKMTGDETPTDNEDKTVTAAESREESPKETEADSSDDAAFDESSQEDSAADESSLPDTDKVEVNDAYPDITPIPEEAVNEITYLGDIDITMNFSDRREPSAQAEMFGAFGGNIKFEGLDRNNKYDELAVRIISNSDIPDIVSFDSSAFPINAIKEIFQPVDSLVDFDSPLWAETKSVAEGFALNGSHYAAPISLEPMALVMYDGNVIEQEGLDDPYELYLNGEWDWDSFGSLMEEFCSGGEGRYGVNGFFAEPLYLQTGKSVVGYRNGSFISNIADPDIARAHRFLRNLYDDELIDHSWYGNADDALKGGNVLFYSMGTWAMTDSTYSGIVGRNGLSGELNYRMVPIPRDPMGDSMHTAANIEGFLWVNGSQASDAVKTWLECCRVYECDEEFKAVRKEQFLENNPGWNYEMYEVLTEASSFDNSPVFEYVNGISGELAEPDEYSLTAADKLIGSAYFTLADNAPTWEEIQNEYSDSLDEYIGNINSVIDN